MSKTAEKIRESIAVGAKLPNDIKPATEIMGPELMCAGGAIGIIQHDSQLPSEITAKFIVFLMSRAPQLAALIEAAEKAVDEAFANGSDYHWIHETRDALRALEETK